MFDDLRDRLSDLAGDPLLPRRWRQRAIELHGMLPPEPHLDPTLPSPDSRARDLLDAARIYREVFAVFRRFEAAIIGARNEPEAADWRSKALDLVEQFDRGRAQ